MPASAFASTCVSRSVARIDALRAAVSPSASISVIAIEYGSSPVDAAEHQTDTGAGRPFTNSDRIGKWCDSRKNAVRLVVSALVNASHSSGSSSCSSRSR